MELIHVFIPLLLVLQLIYGKETTASCQLENDGDFIRKVTLFSSEAVGKIPLDLEYIESGQKDAKKVVMCDWGVRDCVTDNDFLIDSLTVDSLSIKIVSSSYCRTCGEFQFWITPDKTIKCKDLYQTTTLKSSSGNTRSGKGVRTRPVVGISFLTLLTTRCFSTRYRHVTGLENSLHVFLEAGSVDESVWTCDEVSGTTYCCEH